MTRPPVGAASIEDGEAVPTTLGDLAHARSGDKGNSVNIGVWAREPRFWPLLLEHVTAEQVAAYFGSWCYGVTRYELPNLQALNFVLANALDGGGSRSLRTDAQGKAFGVALLRMPLPVRTP